MVVESRCSEVFKRLKVSRIRGTKRRDEVRKDQR